jgi:predicted Zn-dependent protease
VWQGDTETALRLWGEVRRETEDPSLRYLAHVFAGRTLIDYGRPADAMTEFRAALRLRPHTQSAAVPLASLLYLTDQRQEAAAIIDGLLRAPAVTDGDPWAVYLAPGSRDWPAFLRRLRSGLR